MAIVSSTSGSPAAQSGWQQLKLLQAKRSADQAEQAAQSLQQQAQEARRTADRADERARTLAVDSDQAQAIAGKARLGLAATQSEGQMQTQVTKIADQVIQRQQNAQTGTSAQSAPVINTQGQLTGTVVNTTA